MICKWALGTVKASSSVSDPVCSTWSIKHLEIARETLLVCPHSTSWGLRPLCVLWSWLWCSLLPLSPSQSSVILIPGPSLTRRPCHLCRGVTCQWRVKQQRPEAWTLLLPVFFASTVAALPAVVFRAVVKMRVRKCCLIVNSQQWISYCSGNPQAS